MSIDELRKKAEKIRRSVVEMAYSAGAGGAHLGGGLSCVEIFTALYGSVLNVNKENLADKNHDRFLAGKAHCILPQYTTLYEFDFITKEEQYSFKQEGGLLAGHPMLPQIGLEYSGGSLGMAMSVAVGMAIDAKKEGRTNKVYVLVGDGECDEGIIWEAAMTASKYKLDNLTIIVDRNGLQLSGTVDDVMELGDLGKKFDSFGFYVQDVDGHDVGAIVDACNQISNEKPNAIIAHTIKGKGISFVENKVEWHQNVLTEELYKQAIKELGGGEDSYED